MITDENTKPISLDRLFRYYRNLPHQAAAIQELEDDIKANGCQACVDRPWFGTWSQSGKQRDYQAAIALIQKFEGFHHDAYLCPAECGQLEAIPRNRMAQRLALVIGSLKMQAMHCFIKQSALLSRFWMALFRTGRH